MQCSLLLYGLPEGREGRGNHTTTHSDGFRGSSMSRPCHGSMVPWFHGIGLLNAPLLLSLSGPPLGVNLVLGWNCISHVMVMTARFLVL